MSIPGHAQLCESSTVPPTRTQNVSLFFTLLIRPRRPSRSLPGFTLIELLVVISRHPNQLATALVSTTNAYP